MRVINNFLPIVTIILLVSCSVTKTSTSKTFDIYGPGVVQNPVLVDLNVKEEKINSTVEASSSSSLESVKREAIAKALEQSGADVLVEPKFRTESSGSGITATVTAWPAYYENFRPMTKDDVELLEAGIIQKANVVESTKIEEDKVDNNAKVYGTLGFLGILLAVGLAVSIL